MDRWLPAHRKADGVNGPYVMGYYTREDIPFQFALAETFTVCDHYFCSVFGPTWPNRLYWMTGTIDPGGTRGGGAGQHGADAVPVDDVAERLQAAGVSWKVYQQDDDYGCNMLEQFASFRGAAPGSELYERGVRPQPEGAFEDDARNDRLPAVSWMVPTSSVPTPELLPAAGAETHGVEDRGDRLQPEGVEKQTAFILNYDENDGLFDHVPPPTPPAGGRDGVQGLPVGAASRCPRSSSPGRWGLGGVGGPSTTPRRCSSSSGWR